MQTDRCQHFQFLLQYKANYWRLVTWQLDLFKTWDHQSYLQVSLVPFTLLIFNLTAVTLGSEITLEEAADVLELTGSLKSLAFETRSALDILLDEQSNSSILTFSKSVDDVLGGGIPLCKLTEVSGIAGVGKTQFW